MWKAVYVSERGTAHKQDGTPCQDACRVRHVEGSILVTACADGAGSASHAHIGADLACRSFVEQVSKAARSGRLPQRATRDDAIEWCKPVREELIHRAQQLQVPLRELACTLLGAVVGEDGALFLQIGDGAMVVNEGNGCEVVFWPQSGEYANTTNFLTGREFEQCLEFSMRAGRISGFAAFTDGLERLILRFADHTVHSPSLVPMFDVLRSATDVNPYFALLRGFLRSEPVNDRTNDDTTLILAVREQDRSNAEEPVS